MKCLLINLVPPASHFPKGAARSYWVPTGLAYIAAALKRAGHDVRIAAQEELLIKAGMDRSAADSRLGHMIEEFRPELVGLSVFTAAVGQAASVAAACKDALGDGVVIVAGGPHPTAMPAETLEECPAVDLAAVGEGEATMVELAGGADWEQVAGVVFRRGGQAVRTPSRPFQRDLDALGGPAYELLDMRHYTTPNRWMLRWLRMPVTNLRTSRGCTNRCSFCAGHLVGGLGVRFHSIDFVIEQLRFAVERLGVRGVHFEDDTLGADSGRLIELCQAICRAGLDKRLVWDGCLRADQACPQVLGEMKRAGCIQVEYGFESGSDRALAGLGKNATAELNRRAVALTRQAGLRVFADIMVGLPGETKRDFRATVDFIRWAKPEVLSAARLTPLPGTPVFNRLDEGFRRSVCWADYAYMDLPCVRVNFTAMPDGKFEKMYDRFVKYFVRPTVIGQILRDWNDSDGSEMPYEQNLRKVLKRFRRRHPILARRVPAAR